MKQSTESSENYKIVIGMALAALSIFLFVWFMRSLPQPSQESSPTPAEAAQYERYESDQSLNANSEQEACTDRMQRDVERYGEQVIDTYDCTQ